MYQIRLLLALFFIGVTLHAEVEDKWKINVGTMFVTNFETDVQLSPKAVPLALSVNTKDQLGMKNDTNVFRIDGYYRFTDSHNIDFSYFSVKSDGFKSISEDIVWDDKTISAGASVSSYFNMDTIKLNYGYSFYNNEKVELALCAGLHITKIDVGLGAEGTITNNGDATITSSYSSSEGVTIPLPVFGFKAEYTVIDKRLFVNYKTDYFLLEYDGYKGSLISSALNLEYRFTEHVGIGAGYNSNKIFVEIEDDDKILEVSNNLTGAMLYLTYIY